jgi:hypothetical protein
MNYEALLNNISFYLLDPTAAPGADGLHLVPRGDGSWVRLLLLPEARFDMVNARLPRDGREMRLRLGDICKIPRMSTFAIGVIINWGVSQMPGNLAFVNVGVWNGFTFLAGMIGNANKTCIGVDNFSEFGGPRDDFMARFERYRSPNHHFYDADYSDYFAALHNQPIGFYIYDGDHSYENQLRGLQLPEPFFADNCIVLVDDTNWPEPRQATLDFIDQSPHGYRIAFDASTSGNCHPTFWNGVMVLQRTGRARRPVRHGGRREEAGVASDGVDGQIGDAKWHPACAIGSEGRNTRLRPLVSIIIDGNSRRRGRVEETIECAVRQTYPNIEVIAVHGGGDSAKQTIARFGGQIIAVQSDSAGGPAAFRAGLRRSRGDPVCLLTAEDTLTANAVEMAIAAWEHGMQVRQSMRELKRLIPAGEAFILVDEDRWDVDDIALRRIPFLERDGQYWGKPSDDEMAIREFERLRRAGARFLAFACPAFWWLDYYRGLRDHLRSRFLCVLENERLIVFDLRH